MHSGVSKTALLPIFIKIYKDKRKQIMSNRLFQSVIFQMKDIVNRIIGVVDENGVVTACSELTKMGEVRVGLHSEVLYGSEVVTLDGYSYKPLANQSRAEYAVFVMGEDREAQKYCELIAVALGNIKGMYDEKYDKNSLLKNILLDNILPSDIYAKSKELHFDPEIQRVVFLIKFPQKPDVTPYDVIFGMFPDKNKESVVSIGEYDVVVIKEISPGTEVRDLENIGQMIYSNCTSELLVNVQVGIGSPVQNIKDLAKSYKEAQVALDVGKIFENGKNVNSYENLGIGRLIYQLPTTLCEMFLQEVFKLDSLESLDRETLATIQSFFENNLNVSETSRKLFVHRNTLVYRLEKIRKITGLDLREFDHAITFKVALMVKKYLAQKNTQKN